MGKTRDLFKKIRDTKGTFHAKMGTIKNRNGIDLTEAEDIKKTWQEDTEELSKKDLHDPGNHNSLITDLKPDILECEVKWVSGGDGIPVKLFQILKDDAVKVLHSICQLEMVSFHSNPKEKQCQRMLKLLHNCIISHMSKVMLKTLQARLQQYVNHELPDVQAGFRKNIGT